MHAHTHTQTHQNLLFLPYLLVSCLSSIPATVQHWPGTPPRRLLLPSRSGFTDRRDLHGVSPTTPSARGNEKEEEIQGKGMRRVFPQRTEPGRAPPTPSPLPTCDSLAGTASHIPLLCPWALLSFATSRRIPFLLRGCRPSQTRLQQPQPCCCQIGAETLNVQVPRLRRFEAFFPLSVQSS